MVFHKYYVLLKCCCSKKGTEHYLNKDIVSEVALLVLWHHLTDIYVQCM